jgi:hypothetical protein
MILIKDGANGFSAFGFFLVSKVLSGGGSKRFGSNVPKHFLNWAESSQNGIFCEFYFWKSSTLKFSHFFAVNGVKSNGGGLRISGMMKAFSEKVLTNSGR